MSNPGKYLLFRTARIAEPITSIPQFSIGKIVRIRYYTTKINKARGDVFMPIYQAWTDDDEDLKETPALLFACTLEGFLL